MKKTKITTLARPDAGQRTALYAFGITVPARQSGASFTRKHLTAPKIFLWFVVLKQNRPFRVGQRMLSVGPWPATSGNGRGYARTSPKVRGSCTIRVAAYPLADIADGTVVPMNPPVECTCDPSSYH
jgi:hypothetical protein